MMSSCVGTDCACFGWFKSTCQSSWRRGSIVPLKDNVDAACQQTDLIDHVIVLERTKQEIAWHAESSPEHAVVRTIATRQATAIRLIGPPGVEKNERYYVSSGVSGSSFRKITGFVSS